MKSRIITVLALVLAVGLLPACDSSKSESSGEASAQRCEEFVRKLEKCDPSASDMPADVRQEMLQDCPTAAAECSALPTETNAQCSKFMGCLYGG